MKKDVRKKMLKLLSKQMRDMSYDDMEDSLPKKAMKVTVASDSKEGLKEGLSKAEEIMKMRKEQGYGDKE